MIYTSYFAKIKYMPKDIIPVAICAKVPDWYEGLCYKKLTPNYDFFMQWKQNQNNKFYIQCFNEQILDKITARKVIDDLYSLIEWNKSKHIALVCYEKPSDFCHRHIVSDWLNKNGYECSEFSERAISNSKQL